MLVARTGVSTISRLEKKLKDKSAIIGILGLGYVGLPLAVAFAEANLKVIGLDVNANRVSAMHREIRIFLPRIFHTIHKEYRKLSHIPVY